MIEAGQRAGRERDASEAESQSEIVTGIAHPVRGPDERAVLVSERHAVFDRRAASLPLVEAPAFDPGPLGPMPTEWTPDLVHCRLLSVDALARRLPRVQVPAAYRSFLGELQPQDAAPSRMKPLSIDEEKRLDWTLTRIGAFGSIDKAVLMGMMSGRKPATISKVTFGIAAREGGRGLKRPSIHYRYRRNLKILAEAWNMLKVSIDDGTTACWLNEASRKTR